MYIYLHFEECESCKEEILKLNKALNEMCADDEINITITRAIHERVYHLVKHEVKRS